MEKKVKISVLGHVYICALINGFNFHPLLSILIQKTQFFFFMKQKRLPSGNGKYWVLSTQTQETVKYEDFL